MTTVLIATIETRNFDFLVVGETQEECDDLLRQAWATHCMEFGADPDLIHELIEDANYLWAPIGSAFRDGERLL